MDKGSRLHWLIFTNIAKKVKVLDKLKKKSSNGHLVCFFDSGNSIVSGGNFWCPWKQVSDVLMTLNSSIENQIYWASQCNGSFLHSRCLKKLYIFCYLMHCGQNMPFEPLSLFNCKFCPSLTVIPFDCKFVRVQLYLPHFQFGHYEKTIFSKWVL